MSAVLLSGISVTKLRWTISAFGLWWAEVTTQFSEGVLAALPPGGAALVMADATWAGTVVAGDEVDGTGRWHIVGGRGGWAKPVSKRGYNSPGGVNSALVLTDTATLTGETVVFDELLTPQGEHYARKAGHAFEVLNAIAPQNWYVDQLGNTHIGQRVSAPLPPFVEANLVRTREDRSLGLVEYAATDSIAALVPGVEIPLVGEIRDIEVTYDSEDDRGLRVLCYCETGATDSRLESYAKIFDALDPLRKYRATYECRVVAQTGNKFTLQPLRTIHGIPDMTQVPYRPGMGGVKFTVAPGSTVGLSFMDGDPSRPYVSCFESPDSTAAWEPIEFQFGGPAGLPIAYQGSAVVAGPFLGAVTVGSVRGKVAPT